MALQKINLVIPDDLKVDVLFPNNVLIGTSDYNELLNIPSFEGQPIKGNLTFQSTGIAPLESLGALTTVVNQKANTSDVQNACGQLQEQITTNKNDIDGLGDQTAEIEAKIPAEASEANQLADKAFVNAEIAKNKAALDLKADKSDTYTKTEVDTFIAEQETNLTTVQNDLGDLGDQVSVIEVKIPQAASETNQLADKKFVQDLTSALNFVTWVDTLPETGESKYIYAVPREETDTDGKQIAALYLWDGTRWNGAGAFSLNVDPDTLATKTDLTNYLPLTGGTLSGDLKIKGNKVLDTADKSVANGVASLDYNKKIPEAQIPDKFIRDESILLDLSAHSLATPKRIFQEKLDDCLYCADKRHTVTLTNFSSGDVSFLFDGNSDTHCGITAGQIGVVSIQGSYNLGMDYPYGYIYCNFYYGCGPQNLSDVTCRVYQNWSDNNVGWVTLTGQEVATQIFSGVKSITTLRFPTNIYGINEIELTLDNTNGTSTVENTNLYLTSVSFFCTRTGVHSLPVLTKWGGDIVYDNLTIPTENGSFIGNLTGTASKATADANGNNIASTYIKANTKGTANGVASLDANAKVPSVQIPVATAAAFGGVKVEFDETTGTLNIKTE